MAETHRLKLRFYLIVLDFISNMYAELKFTKKSKLEIIRTFETLNELRGEIRDELEAR